MDFEKRALRRSNLLPAVLLCSLCPLLTSARAAPIPPRAPDLGWVTSLATIWATTSMRALGSLLDDPGLPPERRPTIPVRLFNVNTKQELELELTPDGFYRAEDEARVKDFFRCRRTGRYRPMAPGVLALLADIAAHYPGRVIEVVSGYRSPPFGAPHSKHFRGHAIDLRVRGVRLSEVRDLVWTSHTGIGLGYYPSQRFLHVDWRPQEHDVAWTAQHEGAAYRYNPRWARRARARARADAEARARVLAEASQPHAGLTAPAAAR